MDLAKPVGTPKVRFVFAFYGCVRTAAHCLSTANRAQGPDQSEEDVYNSTALALGAHGAVHFMVSEV